MQGKKIYHEKLFVSFRLSEHVPENNFYRRLKKILDLRFLYELTKNYYGMRKVNTKGIKQANKIMLTAATAYNLKKLLKFSKIQFGKAAEAVVCFYSSVFNDILMILSRFKQVYFLKLKFGYRLKFIS